MPDTKVAQHTPGPWKWLDYPDGRKLLVAQNRAVIHCPDAPMTCDPSDANLIAAAPELLAALKNYQNYELTLEVRQNAAIAAIAKAEGR